MTTSGAGSTAHDQPGHRSRRLEQLLSAREIVVACGPGGVGKTTTAAALAATAVARVGGRVLVVTVDPARRLADALGVGGIGNAATRVPTEAFEAAGTRPRGELWAAMLDMSESWDALVERHAPDARTAGQILSNPLYQNITRRFAQGHDYIAMERLYELHEGGDYDLLVVDTPPSRNALDLLDAPARMAEFFSSWLLRWLTVPYRSRLVNLASRPFYQVADRVLGSQLLQDLADFFILFQTMREGFISRAEAVNRLLRESGTTFLLVTTLEAVPAREAEEMLVALRERRLHLGLLVCNRVLPASLSDPGVARVAEELAEQAGELAPALARAVRKTVRHASSETVETVLREVASSFANFRLVATREAELLGALAAAHDVTATIGYRAGSVTDLAGLLAMGGAIWGDEPEAELAEEAEPMAAGSTGRRSRPRGSAARAEGGGATTSGRKRLPSDQAEEAL